MPHITLEDGIPGIRSLVLFRPDTGKALYDLAQVLLRAPSTLSSAERELIAAFVSNQNSCTFCCSSHAAAARYLYKEDQSIVDVVLSEYLKAPISDKLKCLLTIADHVRLDARTVSEELVNNARIAGASDRDIHDTVLISAAFCMYNRYVDGLATFTPIEKQVYEQMGERMGTIGYVVPTNN